VVLGNEKVMRARLSDAAFFFRQDKKNPLSECIKETEKVVFQVKLGTLYDKSLRMNALMPHLSEALNLNVQHAERAAALSKCDLMTGMVSEFPELQGLMGYYYALHDGEHPEIAQALNEQYMPRFAADTLPESDLGMALSLADRLDTLVGIFAIGQKPSGVKDPFKLRRHALAVARMLINSPAPLNLSTLLKSSAEAYGDVLAVDASLLADLHAFILERLNSFYQSQGVALDKVLAVRARQEDWLYDLDKRIQALNQFVLMPEALSLSAACKRVNNILNHVDNQNTETQDIRIDLFQTPSEKILYEQMTIMTQVVEPLYRRAEYTELLQGLAGLKTPVDAFFEQVMVMVDDPHIRMNRLALLRRLQSLLQGVADISLLQ
jgi:glycyl-tRNA synthetase beta chain